MRDCSSDEMPGVFLKKYFVEAPFSPSNQPVMRELHSPRNWGRQRRFSISCQVVPCVNCQEYVCSQISMRSGMTDVGRLARHGHDTADWIDRSSATTVSVGVRSLLREHHLDERSCPLFYGTAKNDLRRF
jgi:hypothetical protein